MSAALLPTLPPAATRAALRVRQATHADNAALVALTLACPMRGDIGLVSDRSPDFFALNRLEGERWEVLVAEDAAGRIAGCIALAERRAWVHGERRRTLYVSDFKVHPAWRGGPAADLLEHAVRDACERLAGPDVPVLVTVLAGNRAMERRTPGPRGLPRLDRFATVDAWSVPLLWRRPAPRAATGFDVREARIEDVEEMAALWARVAPGRQWAPAHDAAALLRWIERSPGLGLGSVRIAHGVDGRVAAWAGTWDQSATKRLRVTSWSRRLQALRAVCNLAAPRSGALPLPDVGAPLPAVTLTHLCAPPDGVAAVRALVLDACRRLHGRASLLNIGLDAGDPLRAALRGTMAQATRVEAYATTPGAPWRGRPLGDRPLHFEIALV